MQILKTAHFLPEKVLTNLDLEKTLDTTDDWIKSRTGISLRHIGESITTSDMAIEVGKKLLGDIDPLSIDFVIVATFTPELAMPTVSCKVQGALGLKNACAFDLNAACSGFVYAMNVANGLLKTGLKKGMVIGAEKISSVLDFHDRKTAVLFGDGAGGVLLEDSPNPTYQIMGADGKKSELLQSGFPEGTEKISMGGRGIFNFVLGEVKDNILKTVEKSPYAIEEIDYFLLHQANLRLLKQLAHKFSLPEEKFLANLAETGNTSAASIPILLSEFVEKGVLKLFSKEKILLSGFGGGLTYGTMIITL